MTTGKGSAMETRLEVALPAERHRHDTVIDSTVIDSGVRERLDIKERCGAGTYDRLRRQLNILQTVASRQTRSAS